MISQFRSFFHDRIVATTTRDYLEYFIAATIAVALFLSTAMSVAYFTFRTLDFNSCFYLSVVFIKGGTLAKSRKLFFQGS